jgi:5'-3' exonuclease
MGIPLLFSTLVRTYNDRNDSKNAIIKPTIDTSIPTHLYLDFNAGIYQAIKPEITTDDTLVLHTIEYLDNLCKIIPNCELIYIALDGPPPRGKISQQRDRRFHSICKRNRTVKINKQFGTDLDKSNISNIDTNMITPGTVFMAKLSIAIKEHIKTSSTFKHKKVIFSDASIPGEGEHKIIQYIKSQSNTEDVTLNDIRSDKSDMQIINDYNTIIYGLDADLIMLSLSLHKKNVYLLREANEYGNFASVHSGRKYLFMDLDTLQVAITDHFKSYTGDIPIDKYDRLIDDYIFLCMLLGNDFMPKIHWMSLHDGGYDKILSAYFQIHNHTENYVVDTHSMTINTEMLSDVLFIIKEQEFPLVQSLFEKRKKARIRITEDMTEREKQQAFADFYPLQHLKVEQAIEPNKPGWQSRYYKTCFNMVSSAENLSTVCQIYLKTLVWNFLYYFDECPSWDWYYPYAYAPTLTDIYNELMKYKNINPMSNKLFQFGKSSAVDAQTLLFMVLPFASKNLMALDIQRNLDDEKCPMRIYFPKKYGLNVAFHRYYHECTPIIYKMEMSKVLAFIKNCKLSDDEKKRNLQNNIFVVDNLDILPK